MSKLKVLSLFSGIGAFEKALTNLCIDYELVGFSEIDKYAITSYCAIHNVDESLNIGDVSKVHIDDLPDFDLMTYGFPCQDISIAGRQGGFSEGSNTRSSLLWEAMRIAKYKKPKYMIAENVKNLVGKKFKKDFDKWLSQLDELGYNTYWKVLNSLDHGGIPQSRERVFVVSIRKDVDDNKFEFPTKLTISKRLIDLLEKEVDKKYFISDKIKESLIQKGYTKSIVGVCNNPRSREYNDFKEICPTLCARDYKVPKLVQIGYLGKNSQSNRVYDSNGVARTLAAEAGGLGAKTGLYYIEDDIRKLIPLECWRLQAFDDEDFYKAKEALINTYYKGKDKADSQLYKQAGNSITVTVLEAIFKNLLHTYLR